MYYNDLAKAPKSQPVGRDLTENEKELLNDD